MLGRFCAMFGPNYSDGHRGVGVVVSAGREWAGYFVRLTVFYRPGRRLDIWWAPIHARRCAWRGCDARPLFGELECDAHARPF